jgi:hypothetical protein
MNLLCPNCQKMLTVPEQFAGQPMRCPLCNGTFTVPALPATTGAASPMPLADPGQDIYSLRPDPHAADQRALAPPPVIPDMTLSPPPAPVSKAPAPTPPPPSTATPEGYQHTLAIWFSPRVLPWVAPVCLLLVFILQFFTWLGIYPGSVPAVEQSAWQAAFGLTTTDPDLKEFAAFMEEDRYKPGVSALTIFYLLLFFPVLVVTIASVVVDQVHLKLPPAVDRLLPWRWGIVAAANLVLFFFLGLQILLGFSLDSRYAEYVDNTYKVPQNAPTKEMKEARVTHGLHMEWLHHTAVLKMVILLHVLAIIAAILQFWVAQRGTSRPLPKTELVW